MKLVIPSVFLLFLYSCSIPEKPELPKEVIEQHQKGAIRWLLEDEDTQFTFLGSIHSVSDKPHLNVHGDEWSIKIRVHEVLLGKLNEEFVFLGTEDPEDTVFEYGKKYYITMDHGPHGDILRGYLVVE